MDGAIDATIDIPDASVAIDAAIDIPDTFVAPDADSVSDASAPSCTDRVSPMRPSPIETLFEGDRRAEVHSVALLPGGDLVAAGTAYDAITIDGNVLGPVGDPSLKDVWIVRVSSSGRLVFARRSWELQLGQLHVVATSTGRIIVSAHAYGSADFGAGPMEVNEWASVLASYREDGALEWVRMFPRCYGNALSVNDADDIFLGMQCTQSADFGGGFIAERGTVLAGFYSDGATQFIWDNGGRPAGGIAQIAIASTGQIVTIGTLFGEADFGAGPEGSPTGATLITMLRFSATGALEEHRILGESQLNARRGLAVAIDLCDRIFIGGQAWGTIDFGGGDTTGPPGVFIASYELDLTYRFSRRFDGGFASDIATPEGGGILVAGTVSEGTVDFGLAVISVPEHLFNLGFVLALDADGTLRSVSEPSFDWGSSLSASARGSQLAIGGGRRTQRFRF